MNDDELQRLVEQTACYLAGQDVIIRWRDPIAEHAVGQVVKSEEGKIIIDISDRLTLDAKFSVYLHELAHVRLGHAQFVNPGNQYKKPSQSVKQEEEQRMKWRKSESESDANQLARDWLLFSQKNAWKYIKSNEPNIAAQLRALLTWRQK
jgi:hypothetical protein